MLGKHKYYSLKEKEITTNINLIVYAITVYAYKYLIVMTN